MLAMDKMLDVLEIDLAGIQEKLQSIEEFREARGLGARRFSKDTIDKLEQMF